MELVSVQIDELFTCSQQDLGQVLEEVARLNGAAGHAGAALEAEVSEFFGRDRPLLLLLVARRPNIRCCRPRRAPQGGSACN